jgi:hypothetical protein
MAAKANFSVVKGDTFLKTPTFRRKVSKAPIDLTGALIVGTAAGLSLNCVITNATAGQFSFVLTPTQTLSLTPGVHAIEVVCTYVDTTVQTLIQGNLVVVA